jgi:hypothetical protein
LHDSREATLVTRLSQKREHVEHALAQHLVALEPRDSLHGPIPRDKPAVAIEREDTIDARVDKSG